MITREELSSSLREYLDNVDSQLEDNINLIKTLKSEKYLFFGDSYAEGYTPTGTVTSWTKFTKQLMNIKDEDFYEYYKGGYGFTNGGFKSLADQAVAEISDKEKVKTIVFGGGYNDAFRYTNIKSGMKEVLDIIKSNFPNANILIAPFGWCVEGLTTDVHAEQKISNLINMVLEYQRNAVVNGVGYIDGIYSVLPL